MLSAVGLVIDLYSKSCATRFTPSSGPCCSLSTANLLDFITYLLSGSPFSALTSSDDSDLQRIKDWIGLSHHGGPSSAGAGAPDTDTGPKAFSFGPVACFSARRGRPAEIKRVGSRVCLSMSSWETLQLKCKG